LRVFSCNYRPLRKSGCAIGLINIFTRSNNENDLSATECGIENRRSHLGIDTMLVRWFPQPAAVGTLLFHKPKRFTMEEKAYDNRSDPA